MDKLLRYFSVSRKAGLLELGEEDTGAAVRGAGRFLPTISPAGFLSHTFRRMNKME